MLSFDTCSARLKDGKLVADDGTTLGINGMYRIFLQPIVTILYARLLVTFMLQIQILELTCMYRSRLSRL